MIVKDKIFIPYVISKDNFKILSQYLKYDVFIKSLRQFI